MVRTIVPEKMDAIGGYGGSAGDLNADLAVERKIMSKDQTFRSEDNAFLPLRRRQLSVWCVTTLSKWRRRAKRQKRL